MKTSRLCISCFFACVLLVSPLQTRAQTEVNEGPYREVLLELIEALQKQIIILKAQLELRSQSERKVETSRASLSDSVTKLAVYKIEDKTEVTQIKNKEHRKYFTRVLELFPDEYDVKIKHFIVFDEEDTEFDAFVETTPPEHDYWSYSVSDEIIKDQDSDLNTELIIHELAHIVSYKEILGLAEPRQTGCEDYFKIWGCPAENSYLSKFVDEFWSTSDLKRAELFFPEGNSSNGPYSYYRKNEDEYVTGYAASSPEEDFSESFVFFVLDDYTKIETTARKKVDFFRQFTEMVAIKGEIVENK
ncbi:MAG: hypothetical protein ACI9BF_000908 [Candidatus Paceibacteria bacterium]|jgi:hypothetical protein